MRRPLKLILWLLPVLGFVLGYACAYLFFHGLLETWHFVGKPGEKITRIEGIEEARKLLVTTETGKIYSFEFGNIFFNGYVYEGEVALQPQPSWEKESHITADPVRPLEYYGADFYSWPPVFQVVQRYEAAYLYDVEGKGEVKFALAPDGNLWMWNHQIAGLTGVVFQCYPLMGFFAGLVVILIVIRGNWLKGKSRFNT